MVQTRRYLSASSRVGTQGAALPTDAPVLVQVDGSRHNGSNLKGNTSKALDSLRRVIEKHGQCPPEGLPGFPDGVVTVGREEWRSQFYADVRA